MTFTQAIAICFRKYAVFSGRAQRAEFWWWILFSILGSFVLGVFESIIIGATGGVPFMNTIFSLATFLPSIAVAVRRLHDLEKTGWLWWLWLVPVIGWIVLIIWYAMAGTVGANRYGNDPVNTDSRNNGGDSDGGGADGAGADRADSAGSDGAIDDGDGGDGDGGDGDGGRDGDGGGGGGGASSSSRSRVPTVRR